MRSKKEDALGPLIRKLDGPGMLNEDDRQALKELPFRSMTVPASAHLVREGHQVAECCLLISGYAFRYKVAANGARQIVSFHMAGDVLDLQHLLLQKADHSVQSLTEATVAWVPITAINALIEARPNIGKTLWRDTLIDASIFREWVLNVGQRDAKSRVAHMLCEFAVRRETAGLGTPERFDLPMSQEHIGDATGMTTIHVNRMLMALENDGVIERDKRDVRVIDWERMRRAAGFDAKYLHVAAE